MRRMDARRRNASAVRLRFSQFLARRRQRLSHPQTSQQNLIACKAEWDPVRGLHQGQQSSADCSNRPNRRLHRTNTPDLQIALVTREPSTEDAAHAAPTDGQGGTWTVPPASGRTPLVRRCSGTSSSAGLPLGQHCPKTLCMDGPVSRSRVSENTSSFRSREAGEPCISDLVGQKGRGSNR